MCQACLKAVLGAALLVMSYKVFGNGSFLIGIWRKDGE